MITPRQVYRLMGRAVSQEVGDVDLILFRLRGELNPTHPVPGVGYNPQTGMQKIVKGFF